MEADVESRWLERRVLEALDRLSTGAIPADAPSAALMHHRPGDRRTGLDRRIGAADRRHDPLRRAVGRRAGDGALSD